ncbi:unnamed protein product [Symbiodinium sp. CCMP2456]|nr:unnamed protein product [Symbiodinium sp. CCMP2456]
MPEQGNDDAPAVAEDEPKVGAVKRKEAPNAPKAAAKFKAKAADADVKMDGAIDGRLVAEMIDFARGFKGMLFAEAKQALMKERQQFEGNFVFNMYWGRAAVGVKSVHYDREVAYFSLPKQTWNESMSICLAAANVLVTKIYLDGLDMDAKSGLQEVVDLRNHAHRAWEAITSEDLEG